MAVYEEFRLPWDFACDRQELASIDLYNSVVAHQDRDDSWEDLSSKKLLKRWSVCLVAEAPRRRGSVR
jgi:hypothetical protein